VMRGVSAKVLDTLLGFAAGVMLAATCFSLIVPAIASGEDLPIYCPTGVVFVVVAGILLGGIVLDVVDKTVPHFHQVMGHEGPSSSLHKTWLFIIAITIHNFPEGLAVGVGFGGADLAQPETLKPAISLAIGIGLQNMPEGLAVALPLIREGYRPWVALGIATLTGLVEIVGGLLGAGAVSIAHPVLPWGMAFAAGAMLFVISDEIIPETHLGGHARLATYGVMVGFVIMMAMDNLLG